MLNKFICKVFQVCFHVGMVYKTSKQKNLFTFLNSLPRLVSLSEKTGPVFNPNNWLEKASCRDFQIQAGVV